MKGLQESNKISIYSKIILHLPFPAMISLLVFQLKLSVTKDSNIHCYSLSLKFISILLWNAITWLGFFEPKEFPVETKFELRQDIKKSN